ncbi:MAG: hypothetical protein HC781_10750 [Leptolyngbyaceae cyanobacterium CSU_1_4]|nr:hypothetical protein [Leptolyngbyaceae cyanobacterium CSU_1_4]
MPKRTRTPDTSSADPLPSAELQNGNGKYSPANPQNTIRIRGAGSTTSKILI